MEPRRVIPKTTVEESVVLHLFDLANHLLRQGEQLAALAGLTTQQWIVLLHVAGDPNFPTTPAASSSRGTLPSSIAEARGVSRATISATVAALLRRGLLRQVGDKSDGRRRALVLTAEGARVLRLVDPVRRRANRRLLGAFSAQERAELLRMLQLCLARLDRRSNP